MQQIAKTHSRWDALQQAIKSQNIDQQKKQQLQVVKAYQRNTGILNKCGIYGVCILGVLRYQHSSLAMMGLCSVAALGSLWSDIYLSNKSWDKSKEIVKNVTGYREDFNMKPGDYKRMQAEMQAIRKSLSNQIKDDDLVND